MRSRALQTGPWVALVALVAVGGWHWARIESPRIPVIEMLAMCAIVLAPTLVAQIWGRVAGIVAAVIAVPVALGAASGMWPGSSGRHSYVPAVAHAVNDGAHNWFNATTPFDYSRFGTVDVDARLLFMVIVGVLGWTLVLRRWTVVSIALALILFAFPSTVLDLSHPWLRAAFFLAAALVTLRLVPVHAIGGGGSSQAWALGTAVVVLGLVVSALPGVNKGAFIGWHEWDPLASAVAPRSLSYVWNESYKPLHWHGKPTTVLNVWAQKPSYWKLGTLETFKEGRWTENTYPITNGLGTPENGALSVPSRRLAAKVQNPSRKAISTVRVQVEALADRHLATSVQPIKWIAPSDTPFTINTDSSAEADSALARGTTYSSVVYAADPTPKQLANAGTGFPRLVDQDLTVGDVRMEPFPADNTAGASEALAPMTDLITASNQVWHASGADQDLTEYAAAVDVEAYFRSKVFTYDLTPKFSGGSPILAQFMLTGHKGYCQMFSGSMALVLRLHGIPARVAFGFTTGQAPATLGAPYVVSDRDAHAWVEVFFPKLGWQPFDPTPSRHLPEQASASNPGWKTTAAKTQYTRGNGPAGAAVSGVTPQNHGGSKPGLQLGGKGGVDPGRSGGAKPTASFTAKAPSSGHGFFAWLFVLAAGLVILVGAVKFAAVRWRYLRRGPRAQAAAAYRELATFVGDQGIADSPERTFEDLSGEISRVFGVDASEFADHASRARYAPAEQAAEASRSIRGDLRGVKRGIRRELSLRDRFTGALRVRSALAQITSLE